MRSAADRLARTTRRRSSLRATDQREERAKALDAEVKAAPHDHAEEDRHSKGLSEADVRGRRAAEIPGEEDRAEDGGAPHGIQDGAHEQDGAEGNDDRLGVADPYGAFDAGG